MKFFLTLFFIHLIFFLQGQMPLENSAFDTVPPPVGEISVQAPVHKPVIPKIPDSTITIRHNEILFIYDSLFAPGNGVLVNDMYSKKNTYHTRDYQFAIILLAVLIYLTWITYTYQKELRDNLTVIINSNLGQQIYRDREFSANIFKLLTFFNFAVITGLLIYLLAVHFGVNLIFDNLILDTSAAIALVILAYFLKGLVYKTVGIIFRFSTALDFFRFNSLVIYQLLGIALFPLVILAVFGKPPVNDWALYASLVVVCIALFIRLIKGFSVLGMLRGFHILYFLLYICALEIAPVLIIYKLFSIWA